VAAVGTTGTGEPEGPDGKGLAGLAAVSGLVHADEGATAPAVETSVAPGGLVCPACGQDNWENQGFCISCGTFLKAELSHRRPIRVGRLVTILLAACLVLVGLAGTVQMVHRFRQAKISWHPRPEAPASRPYLAAPALFPEVPRYPDAVRTPSPILGRAPSSPQGLTKTLAEHLSVRQDVPQVAAWYRTHLDHTWREVRTDSGPPRGAQFERRSPDGSLTVLTVSPGYYDKEGKTPFFNITGIMMVRFAPPR
jgi:hypothetical protein